MFDKLARIQAIGFRLAGCWQLADAGISFTLNWESSPPVLYAFVVDDDVMYIGKTIRPLPNRMNAYRYATRSTNIKNNRNIRDNLQTGRRVEIFVLPDNGLLQYGGFRVNLAAGLEDSLIAELLPPWNGGQKETADESLGPVEPTVTHPSAATTASNEQPP